MSPRTMFEKIWDRHVIETEQGEFLLYIDRALIHEVSLHTFVSLRQQGRCVFRPQQVFAFHDHYVPSSGRDKGMAGIQVPEIRHMVVQLQTNAVQHGIKLFGIDDPQQGILHIVPPEQGITQPGLIIVGSDLLLGVAALGFDMTKVTILAGAFTVGVGFGLQNIVNNFVSGLILLFERQVQVGDMIQIEDTAGIVQRIGIRASIVRTASGSEIIVPNGELISEKLVNWTFSSRTCGIDLEVAVAHGPPPRRVIELMNSVAVAHPDVIKAPSPQTQLKLRIGCSKKG